MDDTRRPSRLDGSDGATPLKMLVSVFLGLPPLLPLARGDTGGAARPRLDPSELRHAHFRTQLEPEALVKGDRRAVTCPGVQEGLIAASLNATGNRG